MKSQKTLRILLLFLMAQANLIQTIGEAVPYALLKKILPANPVIIEAGAQFGEDTQWMSQFWPQGKIYAFEPSPESFAFFLLRVHSPV